MQTNVLLPTCFNKEVPEAFSSTTSNEPAGSDALRVRRRHSHANATSLPLEAKLLSSPGQCQWRRIKCRQVTATPAAQGSSTGSRSNSREASAHHQGRPPLQKILGGNGIVICSLFTLHPMPLCSQAGLVGNLIAPSCVSSVQGN